MQQAVKTVMVNGKAKTIWADRGPATAVNTAPPSRTARAMANFYESGQRNPDDEID